MLIAIPSNPALLYSSMLTAIPNDPAFPCQLPELMSLLYFIVWY